MGILPCKTPFGGGSVITDVSGEPPCLGSPGTPATAGQRREKGGSPLFSPKGYFQDLSISAMDFALGRMAR